MNVRIVYSAGLEAFDHWWSGYMTSKAKPKEVVFLVSTLQELKAMPDSVQDDVGYALWHAQIGQQHDKVKVLKGFGGSGVLEVISHSVEGTFRAVYTVRFADLVYVLHVFQKKSKKGIKTPPQEVAKIRKRLVLAEIDYARRQSRKTQHANGRSD